MPSRVAHSSGVASDRKVKGELRHLRVEGHPLVTMICQDDNFTDISHGYGRAGAQLLVVPTNDWKQVRSYHFENSIMRTLDAGYGIVRAASNGISAVVSACGEVLASTDHFEVRPQAVVTDLPLYNARCGLSRRLGIGLSGWLSFA